MARPRRLTDEERQARKRAYETDYRKRFMSSLHTEHPAHQDHVPAYSDADSRFEVHVRLPPPLEWSEVEPIPWYHKPEGAPWR